MKQDLIEWLISTNADKDSNTKNPFKGTGLLLAPLTSFDREENEQEIERPESDSEETSSDLLDNTFVEETHPTFQDTSFLNSTPPTSFQEATSPSKGGESVNEIENVEELFSAPCEGGEGQLAGEGVISKKGGEGQLADRGVFQKEQQPLALPAPQAPVISKKINDVEVDIDPNDTINISKAWQEKAAGFALSLDEPPPELWTRINEEGEDFNDEDIDYEQGMSLQGAAYIQKRPEHGKNFTERLHQTLKGRKQKAEVLKEEQKEKNNKHPYFFRASFMCFSLVVTLGLAWLTLIIFQKYFVNVNSFIAPPKDNAPVVISQDPTPAPEPAIISQAIISAEKILSEEPEIILSEPVKVQEQRPVTFDAFLNEGNNFFNSKNYDEAIINFFQAYQLDSSDIRAYIGLAEAYKAKKMYFEAVRILEEAVSKFGVDPTVKTILENLRGVIFQHGH